MDCEDNIYHWMDGYDGQKLWIYVASLGDYDRTTAFKQKDKIVKILPPYKRFRVLTYNNYGQKPHKGTSA